MIILCDVDGVLASFLGSVIRSLNEKVEGYHKPFKLEDVTEWDIAKCLDVDASDIYALAGKQFFCEDLEVLPGALEGVELLRRYGHVYFCTSPIWSSEYWMHERVRWLKRHFDARPQDVIMTSAKSLICADLLIDDKPKTVEGWIQSWASPAEAVLWKATWNASWTNYLKTDRITHTDDWSCVEQLLKTMTE